MSAWVLALGLVAASAAGNSPDAKALGFTSSYDHIAIMPLSSLGSTQEATQAVERILMGELEKLLGDRMIPPNRLGQSSPEAEGAFESCDGVVSCLVEVVGGLGWDAFVVGNIAGLGDERVINLKLFDVRTGGEVRRSSEKASGEEKKLIYRMRSALVSLLAPELLVGTIAIDTLQEDVEIFIDGKKVGTTPLADPRFSVPVGRHAVEAKSEGRVPYSSFIDVAYEETATVNVLLPDNTVFVGGSTPFRARWWTWSIAGLGVVSAGLGAFFNIQQANTVDEIEEKFGNGNLNIGESGLYGEEERQWKTAVGLYATAGVLLATTATLLGLDLIKRPNPELEETDPPPVPEVSVEGLGFRF